MAGRGVIDAVQVGRDHVRRIRGNGNDRARPNLANGFVAGFMKRLEGVPTESTCTGPSPPSGMNTPSTKGSDRTRWYWWSPVRPRRSGLASTTSPVVGSMPRPRRPEKPLPPATTSTRSSVLIVFCGISRTNAAGFACGTTTIVRSPARPFNLSRFILVQDPGNAYRLSLRSHCLQPHQTAEDVRNGIALPAHLDAELRAEIGDGGGGSADREALARLFLHLTCQFTDRQIPAGG